MNLRTFGRHSHLFDKLAHDCPALPDAGMIQLQACQKMVYGKACCEIRQSLMRLAVSNLCLNHCLFVSEMWLLTGCSVSVMPAVKDTVCSKGKDWQAAQCLFEIELSVLDWSCGIYAMGQQLCIVSSTEQTI